MGWPRKLLRKDNKNVFLLRTIHAPPEVPDWVMAASDEDGDLDDEQDAVRRCVKRGKQWHTVKVYQPNVVRD